MILALGVTVASCSSAGSDLYVDQLVERFDVDECADVQFIRAGRNPDMRKSGGLNVYIADRACIDAMHRAFEIVRFRKIGETAFEYRSDRGWADVVTLTALGDGSRTRIDWEIVS
jgi:hypothetical protein